ncbi:MAG: UDP-N-acetylmuramate--L-alanine ligase [Planctomycetota bacterium]
MIAQSPRSVHIVGVGGSALSGLARILSARGVEVTGSDGEESAILQALRGKGFHIAAGHRAENLPGAAEAVVYSAAVPEDNPELKEARRRGLPTRCYADFLGQLLMEKRAIAVAGTHGKTSTVGMLASIFLAAGRDPSVLMGGYHPGLQSNCRAGAEQEFLVEACEFNRSFLAFHPWAGIVTNIELDHPDVYPDESTLAAAFGDFLKGFRPTAEGLAPFVVINPERTALLDGRVPAHVRCVRFGESAECEWRLRDVVLGPRPSFTALRHGVPWARLELRVAGRHNVLNALAAVALCGELEASLDLGLTADAVRAGLLEFPGVERRFTHRGHCRGVDLIDDYAHHPTEVACTLAAAREVYPGRRVWAVFQAHQFGRLQAYFAGFGAALGAADEVLLLPVYSVRECAENFAELELLERLRDTLVAGGGRARLASSLSGAEIELSAQLRAGDVCVVLGAGDAFRLTAALRQRLETATG